MIEMSRIPDLTLLRTLKVVAAERSFTQAAKTLNLTQSAVSHQIRKLEQELGVQLLTRDAHQVSTTDAAVELLKKLEPVFTQLDRIFLRDKQQQERFSNTLEIELQSAFNSDWLTPRLASFTNRRPHIRIELNITQKRLEFRGDTELAIKWGKPCWPGYKVERLMGSRLTPMCSPLLLERGNLKQPSDLRNHKLLHDRDESSWKLWARAVGLKKFDVTGGHIFQDTFALQQAAIRGHGVALYARELAEVALGRGDLVAPFPEAEVSGAGEYYLITKRRKPSRLASEFIAWLQEEVSAERAGNSSHQPDPQTAG